MSAGTTIAQNRELLIALLLTKTLQFMYGTE